jgi:hypothetical protein
MNSLSLKLILCSLLLVQFLIRTASARRNWHRTSTKTTRNPTTGHVGVLNTKWQKTSIDKECVISNFLYEYFYLRCNSWMWSKYPTNRVVDIFKNAEKFDWTFNFRGNSKFFESGNRRPDIWNMPNANWILSPVMNEQSGTYYIKNSMYGEFLFAANDESKSLFTYIFDGKPTLSEEYMWRFEQQSDGSFKIINLKFKNGNLLYMVRLS